MRAAIGFLLGMVMVTVTMAQPPYVIWNRIYGGEGDDHGYDIQRVSSGGCIVVGSTTVGEPNYRDVYLIKIDDWGDVLWTSYIGGTGDQCGNAVKETAEHGFIICGSTTGGSYLVKTDTVGTPIWERTLTGYSAEDVIQTDDGGYAFTGGYDPIFGSILLAKTDTTGVVQWHRTYGAGVGYGLQQTPDGGFLVVGVSDRAEGVTYVIRTDNSGDTLWTRTFGSDSYGGAYDVKPTPDGGHIVVGYSEEFNPPVSYGCEILLVRLDPTGDSLWTKTYSLVPGAIGLDYWGQSVILTQDGGYLAAGTGTFWIRQWSSFGEVVKVDSLGNLEWWDQMGGGGWMGGGGLNGVVEIGDGDYIAAGSRCVLDDSTGCNVQLIRFNEYTGARETISPLPYSYKLSPSYPNPFNASTIISYEIPVGGMVQIKVYDVLGRNVAILHDGWVDQGEHRVIWNAGDLPSGIYFCRMASGEFTQTRKVVLLK